MRGATSRAPHSRMDCSRRRCSSLRSKLSMVIPGLCAGPRLGAKGQMLSRAAGDVHRRAAIDMELARGALPVRGNLETIGAAEQRADFAGADVGVGRDDPRHLVRPDANLEPAI